VTYVDDKKFVGIIFVTSQNAEHLKYFLFYR